MRGKRKGECAVDCVNATSCDIDVRPWRRAEKDERLQKLGRGYIRDLLVRPIALQSEKLERGLAHRFFEDIDRSGASKIYGGTRMGSLGNASMDQPQRELGGGSSAMASSYMAFLEYETELAKRETWR